MMILAVVVVVLGVLTNLVLYAFLYRLLHPLKTLTIVVVVFGLEADQATVRRIRELVSNIGIVKGGEAA